MTLERNLLLKLVIEKRENIILNELISRNIKITDKNKKEFKNNEIEHLNRMIIFCKDESIDFNNLVTLYSYVDTIK